MAAPAEKRQVVRYAFYKLDPAWRRLTAAFSHNPQAGKLNAADKQFIDSKASLQGWDIREGLNAVTWIFVNSHRFNRKAKPGEEG